MNHATKHTAIRGMLKITPVGKCIYCGETSQLSDEHVIPFALSGNLVLPSSSCRQCAKITSAIEHRVLRGFMLDARTTGNYSTRRPQKRPKSLSLQIKRGGIFQEEKLTPEEHPAFLHLPILDPPGILAGRKPVAGVSVIGFETLYFGKNPSIVAKDLGAKTIQTTTSIDVSSFARLLAKIGYSFAIATLGQLPREQIPILPLILGITDDASYWLGSANFTLLVEANKPLHALAYSWIPEPGNIKSELLIVRVKLFVPSGASGYEIIVCRRPKNDEHTD